MYGDEIERARMGALDLLAETSDQQFRREYGGRIDDAVKSWNTKRSYRSDWVNFEKWCISRGLNPLPADEKILIAYVLYWGDPEQYRTEGDTILRANTLARKMVGIRHHHISVGAPWPEYRRSEQDLIAGTIKYIAIKQKAESTRSRALDKSDMERAVSTIPYSVVGKRNRALLMIGFYGALRRSEIVGIDMSDLYFSEPDEEGIVTMRVNISSSKTDKTGTGAAVYISSRIEGICPVATVNDWIGVRGNHDGALFVSTKGPRNRITDHWVNKIFKTAMDDAGLDSSQYSAHSLRSGFATTAARAGVHPNAIREQTRHSSMEMLNRYIHDGASMRDNATRHI